MLIEKAIEVVYDEFELDVLQRFVDQHFLFQGFPDSGLGCFQLPFRRDHEKACGRLGERRIMKVIPYAGEDVSGCVSEEDPLFHELKTRGLRPAYFFGILGISYIKEVILPGVYAQLTKEGVDEVTRLFKAGILKKNDY